MVVYGRQWASMGYDVLINHFHGQGTGAARASAPAIRQPSSLKIQIDSAATPRRKVENGDFVLQPGHFYCSSFVLFLTKLTPWPIRNKTGRGARRPVSRVLYPRSARAMAIHLGRPLPDASRDRPGRRRGNPPAGRSRRAVPTWSCSRWGLPCRPRRRGRGALLPHPFTLAGGPEPEPAVCFLWHFPWGRPRRALPGTVFPWSPDFPPPAGVRPTEGGHPAVWHP